MVGLIWTRLDYDGSKLLWQGVVVPYVPTMCVCSLRPPVDIGYWVLGFAGVRGATQSMLLPTTITLGLPSRWISK